MEELRNLMLANQDERNAMVKMPMATMRTAKIARNTKIAKIVKRSREDRGKVANIAKEI